MATFTPNPGKDLFMSSGDHLSVHLHDTAAGLRVDVSDLTRGTAGSMTASAANGFGQVNYQPSASSCSVTPYDFHPMYATSSAATRVVWAAHSYNVAFADEIGHFELWDNGAVTPSGTCASSRSDPEGTDSDDVGCFPNTLSSRYPVNGCLGTDTDFDGTPYINDWPGTAKSAAVNGRFFPTPIRFSSPILTSGGTTSNYSQAAFEADMPRVENFTTPPCQRHVAAPGDPHPGAGCVNPPAGAAFYPFFSTTGTGSSCLWQLGGANIPATTNTFGGSSTTEFGTRATGNLLDLTYPGPGGVSRIYENFRNIQSSNPCPA